MLAIIFKIYDAVEYLVNKIVEANKEINNDKQLRTINKIFYCLSKLLSHNFRFSLSTLFPFRKKKVQLYFLEYSDQ